MGLVTEMHTMEGVRVKAFQVFEMIRKRRNYIREKKGGGLAILSTCPRRDNTNREYCEWGMTPQWVASEETS